MNHRQILSIIGGLGLSLGMGCGCNQATAPTPSAPMAKETPSDPTSDAPPTAPKLTKANAPGATAFTHLISTATVYYLGSPQQGRPPEGEFPKGSRVRVLQDNGGHLRVESKSGITAWVSAGAVEKAP